MDAPVPPSIDSTRRRITQARSGLNGFFQDLVTNARNELVEADWSVIHDQDHDVTLQARVKVRLPTACCRYG